MKNKIVALLYLLIRDELPAGVIIKKVKDVQKLTEEIKFSNPHMLALAKDLVGRLEKDYV